MLQNVNFKKPKMTKEEYKAEYDELVGRLAVLQSEAVSKGIGMVVLFEGWAGAGKGSRISDLLYNMDARATTVYDTLDLNVEEARALRAKNRDIQGYFPYMQDFWKALGPRGNITFFNQGWYTRLSQHISFNPPFDSLETFMDPTGADKARIKQQRAMKDAVQSFESQLVNDGYIVKKFFLHITKETQSDRLRKLAGDPETRWRVSEADMKELGIYDHLYEVYDGMLESTDFDFAPWIILNGEDKRRVNLEVIREIVSSLEERLNAKEDAEAAAAAAKAKANSAAQGTQQEWVDERQRTPEQQAAVEEENRAAAERQHAACPKKSKFKTVKDYPILAEIPHDKMLEDDEAQYKPMLKKLQRKLDRLETEMYKQRIPLVIMYEGSDAGGKGGNIKRVAQALDARAYTIFPSPAPTKPELMHPFLWRYWTRLPKAGHVGIYDRSWYGRVLVERVEGFASDSEWGRAYDEINEFERDLQQWGAIVIKFWVNISREEQLARFEAREQNPLKQWKITAEDWRNRDKYPQYDAAVQDMFRLTSTVNCPWHVLESDDKHYARIKALTIITDALEERLYGKKDKASDKADKKDKKADKKDKKSQGK